MYFSQQGEDYFINRYFINRQCEDGIFLEVGGYDGVTYSNSLFFERELGFKGVLIEPIPHIYEQMRRNRPAATCYNLAIGYGKPMSFIGRGATAGLKDSMSDSFKRSHHRVIDEYEVPTKPLSEILAESGISHIDLMSIDVEGGEEIILQTMNWDIEVYIVCIELDGHNKEKDARCRNILQSRGFQPVCRMCINEFWVNPNYSKKARLYDKALMRPFRGIMKESHRLIERGCVADINRTIAQFERSNRV